MWLTSSSIGRKFVMAITGCALILFVTFHVLMNAVCIIWPTAYNQICEFLGANWYALVASAGLALLFIIHIVYACWLTVQNRRARGDNRYAVTSRPPQVEWSSKNMLVLGIVILAFLVVHLIQFWAKMQWQELRHADLAVLPQLNGVPCAPAYGTLFIQMAFEQVYTPIIYIIGFIALWFHMNHGFWSMFHTAGWDNNKWIDRLKSIGWVWTTLVVALFICQAIAFTVQAHRHFYTEDEALQQQYAVFWEEQAGDLMEDFDSAFYFYSKRPENQGVDRNKLRMAFLKDNGKAFIEAATVIEKHFEAQCPKAAPEGDLANLIRGKKEAQLIMASPRYLQMFPPETSAQNVE